jgi:HPt (histidine-containing phosphotransfer) domain-containing protein
MHRRNDIDMDSNDFGQTRNGCPADVFDHAASLEQIGGETDLLEALVAAYLEQEPALLQKLEDAVSARDATSIRKAAHALASSVSVVCALRARSAAKTVEEIGLKGDLSPLEAACQQLRDEFRQLRTALQLPPAPQQAA